MLDYFAIATRGGIILWSKSFVPMFNNPTSALIQSLIQTTKSEDEPFYYGEYQINCQTFDQLNSALEHSGDIRKKTAAEKPKAFEDTKKFQKSLEGSKRAINDLSLALTNKASVAASTSDFENVGPVRKGTQMRAFSAKKNKAKNTPDNNKQSQKGKTKRIWDDGTASKELIDDLDFSTQSALPKKEGSGLSQEPNPNLIDESSMGLRLKNGTYTLAELSQNHPDFNTATPKPDDSSSLSITGRVGSFFKNLTSGLVLTEKDLAIPISKISEHLVSKNVAAEIAKNISDSVLKELIGARIGGLQKISSLIYPAMEKTLTRILTPSTSTDVLTEINHIKTSQNRPYSIVFVGVNGVGKSTNLSKVCFWLLQNNYRVLIAACDTFRSGAVEQLRVHVNNLRALSPKKANVDIFERGYGKDSAAIAKEAITFAESNGYDIVLIDTAGRMQDNEPLMRALAKLVSVNNPDKVLFVGEALVGNEAVKQLTKFNQALVDYSSSGVKRTIDGIILSKFDTIDDKVGAALTMTFITGKPILFIGTGQTYTDLRNVKISSIVETLLKD
ncbi:hypothetical protein BB561_000607 [Smittium simulii]|uniref:SRP54-type proteins GTP-binding domain-containing protein n=1 Tax=Smittium simulii TaxID=133385 RepID=A0A2T9YYH2_9FUNG|nr:hypothetical protein BB561_000607 [Smittium simulii]